MQVRSCGRCRWPWKTRGSALARGDEEAATVFLAVEVVLGAEQSEGACGGVVVKRAFGLDKVDFDGVDLADVM